MTIESFKDANMAILDVYAGGIGNWSEWQADKLRGIIASVIAPEQVSHFTEFAFAQRESLSIEARLIGAEVATFAGANGFYGLGEDARGFRIAAVLRGADHPMPEPKADWIEPVTEEQPAPAEPSVSEQPPIPGQSA